ncbi:hypothetical protein OsJ_08949 [Oryza sativa Japonica Group]|uniref:Uncharacterized protein n=1 Tax=Oryza sativa subsp. japonica TaxID=39947 RepID=B9F4L4_ORYSJ|nr:hypothetical protein OsJ_08949 [Oryza sativa Japonica Group]
MAAQPWWRFLALLLPLLIAVMRQVAGGVQAPSPRLFPVAISHDPNLYGFYYSQYMRIMEVHKMTDPLSCSHDQSEGGRISDHVARERWQQRLERCDGEQGRRPASALSVEFTKSQVVTSIPGFFFCIWYSAKKHWLANNVLGIAFCIQGIEMLSLGSFKTGAILLGMKLLPMGRKSLFYLTIYGSAVGVGSYAVHYFSTLVASILENFGLSEEMHNPETSRNDQRGEVGVHPQEDDVRVAAAGAKAEKEAEAGGNVSGKQSTAGEGRGAVVLLHPVRASELGSTTMSTVARTSIDINLISKAIALLKGSHSLTDQ